MIVTRKYRLKVEKKYNIIKNSIIDITKFYYSNCGVKFLRNKINKNKNVKKTNFGKRIPIIVIGPLPPPMHGMAKNTALIAEELRARYDVTVADTSPGALTRSLGYHLTKITKFARAIVLLILRALSKAPRLYLPADAGLGMYYTIILATLARLTGYRIFIHHRSFAYLDHRRWAMSLLTRCAGAKAIHLLLCPTMSRQFQDLYPHAVRKATVSNAWCIEPAARLPDRPSGVLRLGHLSNLSREKGLSDVLATFRELLARGTAARLVLAGPEATPEAAAMLSSARSEFGASLDYRGPVYGEDKDRFYVDIDVFLFPTRYRDEAQPNVIFEAMASGVPAISYGRGCIAGDLVGSGGVVVPTDGDFTAAALPMLLHWARNENSLLEAKRRALARARTLKDQALSEFRLFVETLSGQ